ncbi:hypothetical protein J3369_18980 [Alteromonas sp. NFXS44]|uniref:hypothetical protein n=1 Tax=Alteromonas sp. NFXS44 TaxID=2818435 RepID=UPI0032DFD7E1
MSVIIHLILLAALALMESKRDIPEPVVSTPITATLIRLPQPQTVREPDTLPETIPEASVPDKTEPAAPESKPTQEQAAPPDIKTPPAVKEPPQQQPVQPETSEPVQPPVSSVIAQPAAPTDSGTVSNRPSLTSRRALDAFFSRQQAASTQQDAEQVAKELRRAKTSPDISDPRKGAEKEDPLAPPPAVEVDCSSKTTQTLAFISRFTGGRATCSDRGKGFEKFIDARINKGVKEEENQN